MSIEYWSAKKIKELPGKPDFNNSVCPKFKDVISSIRKTKEGFCLTAGYLIRENKAIKIYIHFEEKDCRDSYKVAFPFPFPINGRIEFPLSKDNVKEDPKNSGNWALQTSIKEITVKNKENESFVYVERFKWFVPLNNKKENPNKPFPLPLLNGLKLYLIVPENKISAGEFDFLSNLHPHIWCEVKKTHVNFYSAEALAAAIKNVPEGFNCVCVLRGGGRNLDVFDNEKIQEAIKENSAKVNPPYLIAGIGHAKDDIKGLRLFDYNASSPTAAAVFLNSQFPISADRDQILPHKKQTPL